MIKENDVAAVLLTNHDCVQSRQGRASPDVCGTAEHEGTLRGMPSAPAANVSAEGHLEWDAGAAAAATVGCYCFRDLSQMIYVGYRSSCCVL